MEFFEKKIPDKLTTVLCRMNNGTTNKTTDTFRLLFKDNLTELVDCATLGTPVFNMKQVEIFEKYLLVEVNYYFSTRGWKRGANNKNISAMEGLRQTDIVDMFQGMKAYWEAYGKTMNLDGVIFVYGINLSDKWAQLFQKNSDYQEESAYGKIFLKSYVKYNYLCGHFSDTYKALIDKKKETIRVVGNVLERIKLLSPYVKQLDVLYDDTLTVYYAGLRVNITIHKERSNEVKIYIWKKGDKYFTTFNSQQEKEMFKCFLRMKHDQRLANLVEPPKKNFEEVMRLVGLDPYALTGLKHKQDILEATQNVKMMLDGCYNYLRTFGDWEFIEVEMGEIITSKSIDRIENHRYRTKDIIFTVFEMKSNNYWYHIVIERQTNRVPELRTIKVFMSDTNEIDEANEYIKQKLTDDIFH